MADLAIDLNPLDIAKPYYKDIFVTNGDLTLTSDATPNNLASTNPVLQDILQRLSFFLGEWFLDNTQGVPYFQQILIKNPDQSKIDAIFQNIILGTPGVVQLSSYTFTPNTAKRVLTVAFACITTSGIVNYSGTIAPVSGGQV
jgi:hypothetical protein